MTCGQNIGNAGKYAEELCVRKNMRFMGCLAVVMPENYIAMFSTPSREESLEIIEKAEQVIDKAAACIMDGRPFPQPKVTIVDHLSSGLVNNLFYPLFVHAKKFYPTDSCISCGKCVQVCPLNNIRLEPVSYTHLPWRNTGSQTGVAWE